MSVRTPPQQPRFVAGPTTLYAQLASVLRNRIVTGEWATGQSIPSLEELGAQYGLGRITVRQALQLLGEEGLISSQRGRRTSVTWSADRIAAAPLYSVFANIGERVPNYTIRLISRARVAHLPPGRWDVGNDEGPYMHIRKVDHEAEQPYGYSSIYVAENVYKHFPKGAEKSAKLAQLALKYARPRLETAQERLTVEPIDRDAATELGYPMSAPAVRAIRVFRDTMKRVIYYGISIYRGDRFCIERDMTEYLHGR